MQSHKFQEHAVIPLWRCWCFPFPMVFIHRGDFPPNRPIDGFFHKYNNKTTKTII